MASKIKAAPQNKEATKGRPANPPDRSVLDHSNAAVEELIRSAKKHGFVTVEQIALCCPRKRPLPSRSAIFCLFLEKWA
jgi:hypothetical protein